MGSDVIYFSINNWFRGRDYPIGEPFDSWMREYKLTDEWCKENKICVKVGSIDMSINFCVTATREWVEKNCPQLLTDDSYIYKISTYFKGENTIKEYTKKYSDFICIPDEDGDVYDRFDWSFLEYKEENFGVTYYEDPNWTFDDDDEEEDIDNG